MDTQQIRYLLALKDEGSSYGDAIQNVFGLFGIAPDVYLQSEFGSAIIALVRKGIGISVLPDSYLYHESPGIRFIKLPIATDLCLNWRGDDHNPVLANVLQVVDQVLGPREGNPN